MTILKFLTPKSKVTYLYDYNTVRRGIDTIKSSGYTAIPVITKSGEYYGTVSEGDFLRCITDGNEYGKDGNIRKVYQIVRNGFNPPLHVNEDFTNLLLQLTDQNFVPVVDDKEAFIGIITRKDVMRYFFDTHINKNAADTKPTQ